MVLCQGLPHCLRLCVDPCMPGGGHSNVKGGYQTRPKIHVIRVVFQDQALYARTSFRGAKTCKIGKKGVFLVIFARYNWPHSFSCAARCCERQISCRNKRYIQSRPRTGEVQTRHEY